MRFNVVLPGVLIRGLSSIVLEILSKLLKSAACLEADQRKYMLRTTRSL